VLIIIFLTSVQKKVPVIQQALKRINMYFIYKSKSIGSKDNQIFNSNDIIIII